MTLGKMCKVTQFYIYLYLYYIDRCLVSTIWQCLINVSIILDYCKYIILDINYNRMILKKERYIHTQNIWCIEKYVECISIRRA